MLVDNATADPYGINALYPTLVSTIAASLPPPHWTVQFAAMSHLSNAEKMAFLVQVAESGQGPRAAIEAGKAAAAANLPFADALSGQAVPMTRDQTALFLAGYLLTSPANAFAIGTILVGGYSFGGVSMTFPATTLIAALDSAANGYRVSNSQPILYGPMLSGSALAGVLTQIMPAALTRASGFGDQSYYTAIMGEYRTLLAGNYVSVSDLTSVLIAQAAAGTDSDRSAVGQIFASLYQSGTYSADDVVGAVRSAFFANTLTPAQTVQVFAAIANTVGYDAQNQLAYNIGLFVGSMNQHISIADTVAAVDTISHTPYANQMQFGEFALLVGASGYYSVAQNREFGARVGALLGTTNYVQSTLDLIVARGVLFDNMSALLRGFVAAAAGLGGNAGNLLLATVAGEFAQMVSSSHLTATAAIQSFHNEITATTLPLTTAIVELVFMAASDQADLSSGVKTEIEGLVGGAATASQVLAALTVATGATYAPAGTSAVVAAIMNDLRTQGHFSTTDIIASLTNGSGQPAANLALLVQLAATSDPASLVLIGQEIARLELQGLVPAGSAGSAISAAVSANSLSTFTALSLFMRIAHAAEVANNVAGVAQTMAYADVVPAAQLIGSLQQALVFGVALTSLEEVTILTGAVSSARAHELMGAAVGDELKLLIQTSLTAPQVFARFEAVANAIYPGYYFQQYGYVLAAIANSSDVALQIATGNEIGRLILQGKFTADGSISTTGYPVPTGDLATRYTTWLAIAQTDGAAVQRDVGYNIALGLNTNQLGATDIYPVLEHALQVGAVDASHLAGVLAAIGTQDFNAQQAIPASVYELVTLVQNHVITVADAMAGVDAVASTVPAAAISTWLTVASSSPLLANAVPAQIQAFITEGRLTDTTALNAVTSTGSYTSSGTVANVLIGLASIGDSAMQIGAGTKLAGLIASNFTATNILGLVDSAVATAHTMPGVNAIKLMLGFLSAMPNGGAGTDAPSYVSSHIQSYVTAALLTSADATSALISAAATGPVQIVPFAGSLLVGVSTISAAISTVHSAVTAGTLGVHQAVQMLGGIAGGGGTAAAVTEIQAMVSAHQVTMAQVIQDFQAAGITGNLPTAAYVSLAASADAAGKAAIASIIADRGRHFGPSSDSFFTGALQQAALDFIDIANGVKTVQQAISDIEQYAPAHHASTDAGLILLEDLLKNNNLITTSFVVNQEISDRLSLGDFGAEIAERVAEGTTQTYTNAGILVRTDPTAIRYADALALVRGERDLYGGTFTNIEKLFKNDVYVAQSNRDFGSFTSNTISNLIYGNSSYYVPGSGGGGYPFDQALMSMARELQTPINGHNGNDLAKVVDKLKVRVLQGTAATSLVNAIAQGSLTVDQAIEATEKEVAVITQGASAQDAATIRQMALGWLMLKSSEYMAGNFVMRPDPNAGVGDPIKNPPNKQIKVFLPSDVDNLYYKLVQSYFNDAITGLGGISSIPVNKGVTSSFTQASIMAIVSSFMENAVRSAGATTVDQAQVAADTVASLYADGYAKVQGPNNAGVFGTITNQVIAQPGDYHSYISLAAQIYATGVPLLGRYVPAFQGLSTQILNSIGAGEFATPLMVANAASMGIVTLMEMSAVSNALGPSSNLLAGEFTIIGATAGLFGNIVSGVVQAGVSEVTKAAEDLGRTFKNLADGNNAGASASANQMASSLFTLTYGAGFKLEDVAASASDAGRALVDLAKANPSDVVGDLRSLGKNVVNLLKNNIFVSAISDAVQSYIQTVGSAIAAIIPILNDWYQWNYNFFNNIPQQKPSPVVPHASGNILAAAQHALNDRSNFGEFYYGNVVDGYIAGSTVFVDTNGNGVLDAGEYSTTTDANGNYAVPQGVGNIVVVGGVDSSTGLTLTTPLSAPAGSATVTALTTLVQKVQATNNIDTASATQLVASAFGLGSLDLTQLDPVGAVRAGQNGGASLVLATTAALNTLVLLGAAGATGDPTGALAARIANAPLGTTIDLTNAATIADLANASGVSANASSAVAQLASASNTLLTSLINSAPDPTTLLNRATAVTIVAQGVTATTLEAAGDDPTLLTNVVNQYTGTNLTSTVQDKLGEVLAQPAPAPYYGPPRWYLDPMVTGVVSTGSASGNSLSGSQSNQEMQTAFHDAAGSPSSVAFTPTPDLTRSVPGLAAYLDTLFHPA